MKKILFFVCAGFLLLGIKSQAQFSVNNSCTTPWIEISTTGTALNLSDDGNAGITIPFTFYLDGIASSDFTIGNNGGILFNTTTGYLTFSNTDLASTTDQGMFVFWDDIGYSYGNVYWEVQGSAPNRQLIVEWYQRPHLSSIDSATFEIILFETSNQISFLYQDVYFANPTYDYGASATVGVLGQNGAYQYSYNTPSLNGISCITYTPIQHDLGVVSWDSPLSDCGLGASDSVKVTLQNNTLDTATGFTLAYSIDNGSTWVTEVPNDTILPYTSLNYTFSTTADFSATGNYDVLFAIDYSLDEDSLNDTLSTVITNAPVINTFPYTEDFESNNGYWSLGGTNSSWQWGVPSGTVINSAASGTHAWVTNLSGNYNNDESSYILSPCFDFTSLLQPILALKINFSSDDYDGALIQSSTDNGTSWQTIGSYGDPNNWYNFSNTPPLWSGNSNGWLFAKHDIASLAGQPSVKFRVYFLSNSTTVAEGFAMDDFQIMESPDNDLLPISLISPSGGCGMTNADTMTVEIFNAGLVAQDTFNISYSIDSGATWITETYNDSLQPGDTLLYTFNQTADFSVPGDYYVLVAVNNLGEAITSNDTISTIITSIPTIVSYPYFEDFESGSGGWAAGGTNSSWELGIPAGTYVNTAYSGTNSWMTGLSTAYNNYEESYVESPCLDFSSLVQPILELSEIFYTESIDGGYIEYSTDGGFSWSVLGAYGDPDNWYNNSGNRWSGTSATWTVAKHDLTGLGGMSSVKLRVHFHSDGSVVYDGFAFDDVRIYDKPANDLMPLAWVSPVSGCGMSSNDTVKVQIFNNGIAPQDTFDISYSIDSGATWITETYNDSLQPGDTLLYTFNQTADFSAPGDYYVLVAVNNLGDAITYNDTLQFTLTNTLINSFPYQEDFETFVVGSPGIVGNGWTINPATGYTWYVDNGGTSSSNTGPTIDHTLGDATGIYMYTEASNGSTGNEADLILHCTDMSSLTLPQLSFWYHMYGSTIDRLVVDQAIGGVWYPVDSLVGQQQANQTDPWLEIRMNLSNQADSVRFRAIRGTSYTGDIAIDDILIEQAPANDLAAISWDNPIGGCGLTSADIITFTYQNMGVDMQDSVTVSYSIDSGATWVTEMVPDTILPDSMFTYSFSTTADFSALGHYYCFVAVSNVGDVNNSNDTLYIDFESVPLISTFPYTEDFESGNGGWISGGTNSTWELGTPAGTTINTAASGANSWMTNLTGYYNNSENSWVMGPCFDFSSLSNPMIDLSVWVNAENSFDGAALQYSLDGGNTWNNVGSSTDPQWYNDNSISGLSFSGSQEGFTGITTNTWQTISHALTGLGGMSNVKLRIAFGSDGSVNSYDGFAFDDIHIYEATFPDLAVFYPYANDTLGVCQGIDSLQIGLMNVGSAQIDSGETVYIYYQINGGTLTSDNYTFTSPLNVGDSNMITFNHPYNFSIAGTYSYLIYFNYNNDNNNLNDTVRGYFLAYTASLDLGPDIHTSQPDTVVIDAGPMFESYLWQDGSTNQTFQVSAYGTYYVNVEDSNGCAASDTIVVDDQVNVENNILGNIHIYPNPNTGQFVIELPKNIPTAKIEIMSTTGQVIYHKLTSESKSYIDITNFDKGIYFVRITNNKIVKNYKVVIQ